MVDLYYDGQCDWCRAGAKRLKRLDWLNQLTMVDYQSVPESESPVEYDVFDQGMPVRTNRGDILVGFPGVRHAFLRTPIGWLVGWTLYVPGISHLGRRIYDRIARRRPRGQACAIDPTRRKI